MAAIPWQEFTKDELVVLLREFEQCHAGFEQLWSECDVYYEKNCDCSPDELKLPERVLEIKRRVAERIAARANHRPASPLRRLLQRPFRRYKAG